MNSNEVEAKLFRIACRSNANVLLTGPTGSGKTRLAHMIHERSQRCGRPFVTINLATLHEGVLESELFGHEKGAFTGAESKRMGKLELANGGTVFLDEIGELTPRLQARLLEVLQSGMICPVGGNKESRLDIRVIAATHRDLSEAVTSGDFREDLFHRLRVVSIRLRSLLERKDEFDQLLHRCLETACKETGRSILRLSEAAASLLESHDWPGNIRELRNVLEYAVLAAEGREITPEDLPLWLGERRRERPVGSRADSEDNSVSAKGRPVFGVAEVAMGASYDETLILFETEYFRRALASHGWRVTRTARAIGVSKATLIRRMKALGLHPTTFVGRLMTPPLLLR